MCFPPWLCSVGSPRPCPGWLILEGDLTFLIRTWWQDLNGERGIFSFKEILNGLQLMGNVKQNAVYMSQLTLTQGITLNAP